MILKTSTNEENEEAPAKTLEELKAEKEKRLKEGLNLIRGVDDAKMNGI